MLGTGHLFPSKAPKADEPGHDEQWEAILKENLESREKNQEDRRRLELLGRVKPETKEVD